MFKKIQKIGNSEGIIIPKQYLEMTNTKLFYIKYENGNLILVPVKEENKINFGG